MAENNLDLDSNEKFNSLEALFGADLDDIADLPAFEVPPPGAYILKVTTSTKEVNKKHGIECKFEVVETVELKNADEADPAYRAPSKPGTQFSTMFFLGNKIAIARLKQFLIPFGTAFGETKVEPLVRDLIKDVVISATITNRADKDDPERIYASVNNIAVA